LRVLVGAVGFSVGFSCHLIGSPRIGHRVSCVPVGHNRDEDQLGHAQNQHRSEHSTQDRDHRISPDPSPVPLGCTDPSGPDRLVGEEQPEIFIHRLGRLVPSPGIFLDRLEYDRLQIPRNPGIDGPGLLRLDCLDLLDQFEPVLRVKYRSQGKQLVERQPQPVDVGTHIPFTPKSLGRHVANRTENEAAPSRSVAFPRGQTEVCDPRHALNVQEQVGRLDVSVYDPPRVRVGQAPGDLPADLSQAAEVRAPPRLDGRELDTPWQYPRARRCGRG
jgi:hypothetical protein